MQAIILPEAKKFDLTIAILSFTRETLIGNELVNEQHYWPFIIMAGKLVATRFEREL